MNAHLQALFGIFAATCIFSPSYATEYDIVINNGRVMDPESRFEPIKLEGWFETYYASPVELGDSIPDAHPFEMLAPSSHLH